MALFRRKTAEEIRAKDAVRNQQLAVRNAKLVAREQKLALARTKLTFREATRAEDARRAEASAERAGERAERRSVKEATRAHTHPHGRASHHVGTCGLSCRLGLTAHPHKSE